MALTSSRVVRSRLFTHTQPTTTQGESAQSSPWPVGRVRLAKLKRLLSAPPVKTQPYALPPCRMPRRPAACLASTSAACPGRGKWMSSSPLPVVVMESRDVGAHAVHHRHLEGRRRGRQADRHRLQVVAVTPQQSLEEGHAPRRQSPLKDDARQAVNLHDQEPPVRADGGGTTAKTADETIDPTLEGEDQVVQGHRHCRS